MHCGPLLMIFYLNFWCTNPRVLFLFNSNCSLAREFLQHLLCVSICMHKHTYPIRDTYDTKRCIERKFIKAPWRAHKAWSMVKNENLYSIHAFFYLHKPSLGFTYFLSLSYALLCHKLMHRMAAAVIVVMEQKHILRA